MAHTRINHAAIQRSRKPIEIIEEAEQQWIYTEDELRRTPSICDGISLDDERNFRYKGYNFITQVGIMLKLPQTTLSSATVFFNRFLMRYSLKSKGKDDKKLHHYVSRLRRVFEGCTLTRDLANSSDGSLSGDQSRGALPEGARTRNRLLPRRAKEPEPPCRREHKGLLAVARYDPTQRRRAPRATLLRSDCRIAI